MKLDAISELRRAMARIDELEARAYRQAELIAVLSERLAQAEALEVNRQRATIEPARWLN